MTPLSPDAWDLTPSEVEGRLRAARAAGHPGWLWPRVRIETWRAWLAELERVTRELLLDGEGATALRPPAGDGGTEAAGVAAYTSGLGPLLGRWIEEGRLRAPEALADLLALHLEHGRRRARAHADTLDEAVGLLGRAGLPATVLKGAHTRAVYFPEPGVRPSADVDLLLPPGTVEEGGRALAAAGWLPGPGQRRPAKRDWIPPGAPAQPRSLYLAHAADACAVELHDSLRRDFFGVRTLGPPASTPRERRPEVHHAATVLPPAELAAYLALHASEEVHHLQMLRLVELALVVRAERATGRLERGALARALRQAGGARFALPALDLTEKLVPGTVEPTLLDQARREAPARMLRWLARVRPCTAQRLEGVALDERFIWSDGPAETLRRALRLALPGGSGSARPPARALADRLSALVRGRVRVHTPASGPASGVDEVGS
jgi:hypothetical protein